LIKHIQKNKRDEENINKSESQLKIIYNQPDSYKNIVVPKPWGYEFLGYEDDSIAFWFLSIESGHSTSMHCHPNKRTVLIILSGKALGKTLYGSSIINAGEVVVYEAGVFHSTKAISKIEMAEIESPPIKTDLLRLVDNYGRERMGYEDKKTMTKSYSSFYLDKINPLFSQSHYAITLSNKIKCGEINIIGDNCDLTPNSCILETKDIVVENANILNFKFPTRENLYECRSYI
jgi:mannose-6-phosphate isomerase-like protein (cupin superfamily)